MLQFHRRVVTGGAVLCIAERSIVEDVAVLIDFDDCRALMQGSATQGFAQVLDVRVDRACDESRFGTKGDHDRVQRMIDGSHRRALGDGAFGAGGRILTFGQSINAVIEHHQREIHIAPQQMNEVIAPIDSESPSPLITKTFRSGRASRSPVATAGARP